VLHRLTAKVLRCWLHPIASREVTEWAAHHNGSTMSLRICKVDGRGQATHGMLWLGQSRQNRVESVR
jgi:hypothetical protein